MRVFLCEYLTCGASGAAPEAKQALAGEGAAMLRALAADAAAVPEWSVTLLWDADLPPLQDLGVTVCTARNPRQELNLFRSLAAQHDRTVVIAPEFQGLLWQRRNLVDEAGGTFVGGSLSAIALCGDKLALAEHLQRCGLPTVPTELCDFEELRQKPWPDDGWVIKPRFGAGSLDTFHVRTSAELDEAEAAFRDFAVFGEPIVQPFIPGHPVSAAGIVSERGVEVLPVVRQVVAMHARLHYTGGVVPAQSGWDQEVGDLTRETLKQIPGLWGYAGVDLIIPRKDHHAGPPIVMEINPRLTTSYLGYRSLTEANLAERIIDPDRISSAPLWKSGVIEFGTDGTTRTVASNPADDSADIVPTSHFFNSRHTFSWHSPVRPTDHLEP